MARGTMWAAGTEAPPSQEELLQFARELNIPLVAPYQPAALLRAMRTRLNLTQKEFGILISPNDATPISASVICQLETAQQPIPAILVARASTVTASVTHFAAWRKEASVGGSHDSDLSALRALGPGCENELKPFVESRSMMPSDQALVVTEYLSIVSRRKQSGHGDRPATRGPYKKRDGKEKEPKEPKPPKEPKASEANSALPVPPLKPPLVARGPRGPYKAKKKKKPEAVGLPTGACDASSSSDSSPPSTTRSHSSDSSFSSLCGASRPRSPPMSPSAARDVQCKQVQLGDVQLFQKCLAGTPKGQASAFMSLERNSPSSADFLERLEIAEQRDQEALLTMRRLSEVVGIDMGSRGPAHVLSPRSPDSKRRATEPAGREELRYADLESLSLEDFTLDDLVLESSMSESSSCDYLPPLQSIDEIMDLVTRGSASPMPCL